MKLLNLRMTSWRGMMLFAGLLLLMSGSAFGADQPTQAPSAMPPPIRLNNCSIVFANAYPGDYTVFASVSFTNVSDKLIVAARFRFIFVDAFKKPRAQQEGTVTGTFAPGIRVDPRYAALTGAVLLQSPTFPSSPAWHVYNPLGQDLSLPDSSCDVMTIRFSDGTIYENPVQ